MSDDIEQQIAAFLQWSERYLDLLEIILLPTVLTDIGHTYGDNITQKESLPKTNHTMFNYTHVPKVVRLVQ